ncbi:histidine kinase [Rugosimonospora africana]|uniref:histidine kinase n=1 Tax=Rugosimonospora africana TaxID=556532 RepID=A0A8J3QW08_9ACTN|nr:histidine kinase [Rugosimonospora africana]
MYLFTTLGTAVMTVLVLPLLWHPALAAPWARWHRDRAARLRGQPVRSHPILWRWSLRWLPAQVAIGLPAGVLAVLCVGNLLTAVVVIPAWWMFPAGEPPHLFSEVAVTSWGTALVVGLAQLASMAAVAYWVLPLLAALHARVTLAALAPSAAEKLTERVAVLTRTRTGVLEAHGAELRRIERDLHDGTQARLVAIAMRLAVARQALPDGAGAVADLLREAHEGTEEAMTELREVIRTMYPPILADHGLAGALRMVAGRGGIPATVDLGDLGPVPAAVEAVAYFAVTEALTNVAKHSHASGATVAVRRTGDLLSIEVRDDGIGGADERRGTGLTGINRRVQALDGTLTVASPIGGPTEILVELPCG